MSERDTESSEDLTTPRTRLDRLLYVEAATNGLAASVEALGKLIQQNTAVVELLRKEVNRKPDDIEIQTIAGFSRSERSNYLRRLSAVVLIAVGCAGLASYYFAKEYNDSKSAQTGVSLNNGCKKNNQVIDALIAQNKNLSRGETLNEVPGIGATKQVRIQAYDRTVQSLLPLKKDCDRLYPVEK